MSGGRGAIRLAVALAVWLVSCLERAPLSLPPAPVPPPAVDAVVPVHTDLFLAVDPRAATVTGTARIRLEIRRPTPSLTLDFAGTIDWAVAWQDDTELVLPVDQTVASRRAERFEFVSPETLHAGDVLLDIGFTSAPILEDGPSERPGIFRRQKPEPYVYTGFERNGAHRVFPCFDDPRFHSTFSLTLAVPPRFDAFSNMPVRRRDALSDGRTRVAFETSPRLPTYLWAFAVGKPTTHIVDSRLGLVDLAGSPHVDLELARRRLDELTRYFGAPPPFPKLDLLLVDGDGLAMEHPGLITFARPWDQGADRGDEDVITHELAHLWFGDQVGITQWQDEWVKEGLASWLQERTSGTSLDPRDVLVLEEDEPGTIRVPVTLPDKREREQALYTYSKAARVFRMVEQWLGPAVFQRAMRRFVADGLWQAETPSALYRALDTASDGQASAVLESFVSQPGFPSIPVDWQCQTGASSAARVTIDLAQGPFQPGELRAGELRSWTVPVCVRLGGNGVDVRACRVLGTPTARFEIDAPACPRWIHPNANTAGYYRWSLPAEKVEPLMTEFDALDPPAQREVLGDLWSNVQSGSLGVAGYLELLASAHPRSNSPNWPAVVATLDRISATVPGGAAHHGFVDRVRALTRWAETTSMESFVAELWTATPATSAAARALELGENPMFDAELDKLARNPELPKGSPDLVALVFRALARSGQSGDARRLLDEAVTYGKGRESAWLAAGLRDPSILPALAPLFDSSCSLTDLAALASGARDRTTVRDALLAGGQSAVEAFRMALWQLGWWTCDRALGVRGAATASARSRLHCAWLDREIESGLSAPVANLGH